VGVDGGQATWLVTQTRHTASAGQPPLSAAEQQQADWSFKRLSFNPHFSGSANMHAADWSFMETHIMDKARLANDLSFMA